MPNNGKVVAGVLTCMMVLGLVIVWRPRTSAPTPSQNADHLAQIIDLQRQLRQKDADIIKLLRRIPPEARGPDVDNLLSGHPEDAPVVVKRLVPEPVPATPSPIVAVPPVVSARVEDIVILGPDSATAKPALTPAPSNPPIMNPRVQPVKDADSKVSPDTTVTSCPAGTPGAGVPTNTNVTFIVQNPR